MNDLRISKSGDRSKSKHNRSLKKTQSPQKNIISYQNSQSKISSLSIDKIHHSKSIKSKKIA